MFETVFVNLVCYVCRTNLNKDSSVLLRITYVCQFIYFISIPNNIINNYINIICWFKHNEVNWYETVVQSRFISDFYDKCTKCSMCKLQTTITKHRDIVLNSFVKYRIFLNTAQPVLFYFILAFVNENCKLTTKSKSNLSLQAD